MQRYGKFNELVLDLRSLLVDINQKNQYESMSLPVYRFTNRLGEPCHEHPRQKTSVKSNPSIESSGYLGTTSPSSST